jgi:hypothetical protein
VPTALLEQETYEYVFRYFVIRSLTPLGFVLAVWGWWLGGASPGRLWCAWGLSLAVAFAVLAGKLHHEYYWLAITPLAALGVGRSLVRVARRNALVGALAGVMLMGLCAYQSASTWRVPEAWVNLMASSNAVRRVVPDGELVVAPEALLYMADRRGCRLEIGTRSEERAAREWADREIPSDREAGWLVEFYRRQGARYFADVAALPGDTGRRALHEMIRRTYRVIVDDRETLVAELTDPRGASDVEP